MKKIMQKITTIFLKKPAEAENLGKEIAKMPMPQWKKNVSWLLALLGGGVIGIYLGQAIPDNFIRQIVQSYIKFLQLSKVAGATKHKISNLD